MKYFLTALLASTLSVASYAAPIDFDVATDYSSNFSLTSAGGNLTDYAHNAGSGVGGISGFMDVSTNGTQLYYNTGLTKNTTDIFRVSYLINIGTPANDINDFNIGFIRSTGSNFGGGGDSINAYLRSDGGVSTYTMELRKDNTSVTETSQFSITANNWYELRFDMNLDNDAQVDVTTALYNRGADGTSAASLVTGSLISQNDIALNDSGFNGADIFAALSLRNNSGSVAQGWDNFEAVAIPEPGTLALFGIALGTLAIFRRRK